MKAHKGANSMDASLFGAYAVVQIAHPLTHLIQQAPGRRISSNSVRASASARPIGPRFDGRFGGPVFGLDREDMMTVCSYSISQSPARCKIALVVSLVGRHGSRCALSRRPHTPHAGDVAPNRLVRQYRPQSPPTAGFAGSVAHEFL